MTVGGHGPWRSTPRATVWSVVTTAAVVSLTGLALWLDGAGRLSALGGYLVFFVVGQLLGRNDANILRGRDYAHALRVARRWAHLRGDAPAQEQLLARELAAGFQARALPPSPEYEGSEDEDDDCHG